ILPQAVLHAALDEADADRDGARTRDELRTAFGAHLPVAAQYVNELVDILLILFACDRPDALSAAETGRVAPFFARLGLMAHERRAPPEYVAAFDPNVTLLGREAIVRDRTAPLTADRIRAIEAEWRSKLAAR